MADWFTRRDAAKHQIELPGSDEKAEVELRPLNAGDVAAMNELKLSGEGASLALGEVKLLTVERALVGWSLGREITPDTIRQLNPLVFEQIHALVDIGGGADGTGPPTPPVSTELPTEGADNSS